jgi:hypothetical protein
LTSTLRWSGSRPTRAALGDPTEINSVSQEDPATDYGGYVDGDEGALQHQRPLAFALEYELARSGPKRHTQW